METDSSAFARDDDSDADAGRAFGPDVGANVADADVAPGAFAVDVRRWRRRAAMGCESLPRSE